VILSIGAFAIVDDNIYIKDSFEAVLLHISFFFMITHLSNEFIIESTLPKFSRLKQ
jgi:DNA polymerase-3 subunit epsilon